jgi:hypothetical protein
MFFSIARLEKSFFQSLARVHPIRVYLIPYPFLIADCSRAFNHEFE